MAPAGYFYYLEHYGVARCVEELPRESRQRFRDDMTKPLLERQEKDSSLLDYPLYDDHPQYGTAIAVVTLVPPEKPFYGKQRQHPASRVARATGVDSRIADAVTRRLTPLGASLPVNRATRTLLGSEKACRALPASAQSPNLDHGFQNRLTERM